MLDRISSRSRAGRNALLIGGLLAIAASADANTIYQYTGLHFTTVTGVYTTSDSVSGTLTFASPLAMNLSNAVITGSVLAYSFSDGHQTLSGTTPTGVQVSTDAAGNITQWVVAIGTFNPLYGTPICSETTPGICAVVSGDFASVDLPAAPSGLVDVGANIVPGSWSIVPEPSTLSLLLVPLAMAGARRRGSARRS
jgi:hypothetical protein